MLASSLVWFPIKYPKWIPAMAYVFPRALYGCIHMQNKLLTFLMQNSNPLKKSLFPLVLIEDPFQRYLGPTTCHVPSRKQGHRWSWRYVTFRLKIILARGKNYSQVSPEAFPTEKKNSYSKYYNENPFELSVQLQKCHHAKTRFSLIRHIPI